MNLMIDRVREIFPHFNLRAITEEDFWKAAKKSRIVVRELPLLVDGYYQRKRGRHFILIDKKLTGLRWLHTALHEFCHFLFDEPVNDEALYRRGGEDADRREKTADAFALIALLPFPDLVRIQKEDLSDNAWLANLVRDRIVVLTEYGI